MLFSLSFVLLVFLACNCSCGSVSKPNIIVILTDDQDVVLDGLTPMKQTIKLLANQGVTMMNAFTTSPICCPSRSSILTGLYAHNHATINNSETGGCYGDFWRAEIETKALPVLLKSEGYETFYAGKYLNEYKSINIPSGWDSWFGLHGNSKYYNYTLNENGVLRFYENEYLTDILRNISINFLTERTNDKPFFAMVAPPNPHSPYTAAQRHENTFENVNALRTPNFNRPADFLEKHWLLTMSPAVLPEDIVDNIDLIYRKRWQSLLSVDELVEKIIGTLQNKNLLENTFIVFTSDNGYHMGQFGQAYDKRQPYETDIRVPLIIKGPNLAPKTVVDYPVALIDLVPTILEWADIAIPGHIDGESFKSILEHSGNDIQNELAYTLNYERQILIEYWGEGTEETYNPECPWPPDQFLNQCTLDNACKCQDSWNNTYSCIRHLAKDVDKIYCEFEDTENFVESYDLDVDPYQITNLGFSMLPSERAKYSLTLNRMRECIGIECRM